MSAIGPTARARLQPLDVTLRHGRRYQWIRRGVLTVSVGLTLLLPVWHLLALRAESAGLAGDGALALARGSSAASAPPIVGGAGAIRLFGLELVDPLAVISVAVSQGTSRALWWALLPGLVLVLFLGRFFCGWVCPYLPILAASNALRWLLTRLGFKPRDVKLPRRTALVVLAGVLVISAWTGVQVLPLIYPPSVIGREAFNALYFGGLGTGAVMVLLAFGFDTFVSRAGFCRTLCPGGAAFSVLSLISPITIKRDEKACTDCTVCDVVCNLGQKPMTSRLDQGCERCGKCIASCPTKALSIGFGTPPVLRTEDQRP